MNRCHGYWARVRRPARLFGAAVLALTLGGCGSEDAGLLREAPIGEAAEALGSTEQRQTITTLAQLRAMTVTGNYILGNDIDASQTNQPGQQFVPIGGPFNPFRGTFDGNNKKISNLRITSGSWYAGMFSAVSGAIIKRVGLVNVNVSGGGFTGALAGTIGNSEVASSYVTGTVSGPTSGAAVNAVGMVFGAMGESVMVSRAYATGTVTGRTTTIGGFVGEVTGGNTLSTMSTLSEIFTNVNVSPSWAFGTNYSILAGGLVGQAQGAWIRDINSHGNVLGRGYAGGVIGEAINDSLSSMANVLDHAVSHGAVTVVGAPADRAGVIGRFRGGFQHCISFWNSTNDAGSTWSGSLECQQGKSAAVLRAPKPSPNKLINPFIRGELITQQMIDASNGTILQCKLHSGSDGDWGFGTCNTPQVWALRSANEHITLTNIPNPSVQPL